MRDTIFSYPATYSARLEPIYQNLNFNPFKCIWDRMTSQPAVECRRTAAHL
jgi:hypothetical protein